MIPTKICGITHLADAQCAANHGASAIGFIFYNKSPRYISTEKAKAISDQLLINITRIGVFVNHEKTFIDEAIQTVPLSMIQLHGDESPEFCGQFDLPVIKALRVKDSSSLSAINDYKVYAFLLDTFCKDHYGGTGKTFDWSMQKTETETPIILSGGLNPDNILDAIASVNPAAVDINSGVESMPGVKDHSKMIDLFNRIKKIEQKKQRVNVFDFSVIYEHMKP